jgi:phosphoribosylaminoimidazolecarboxamide formyltransferase/IMP cyclohydrolase
LINDKLPIQRALISVSDKSGLDAVLDVLMKHNIEIISTGGTEKYIRERGYSVTGISSYTGSPEILDGRVKTLHPIVHGGLLFIRGNSEHETQAQINNIKPIDLLIVNLYPFEQTVARGASEEEIIENIDIGGPAMLRSAAKNFDGVTLLTSPNQYEHFIKEFTDNGGQTTYQYRKDRAKDAFELVAGYDVAIARYFARQSEDTSIFIAESNVFSLRYGENPHQRASVAGNQLTMLYKQLWGKELSYNNYVDASAALALIAEFVDHRTPVAAIIKHTNPCGIAEGRTILEAFESAFRTDTESPFGGIIVLNCECDETLAVRMNEFFSEVIIAPSYSDAALTILQKKKDRRLLRYHPDSLKQNIHQQEVRSIVGGILRQDVDDQLLADGYPKTVTTRQVSESEMNGLLFAYKVCKHTKSNAIVYAGNENGFSRTLGIGCGQTSRVASSRLAVANAKRFGHSLAGSLVASDAFFPFADGLIEAANAGAIAVIEPGGSVRDEEVIEAAEVKKISLVFTGMRHFKH